ncbi:MAG: barstar family protein [Burkholderiaceae bacterium]
MASVTLDTTAIHDFESFHRECKRSFGFPGFYGRNMNAWIDCLSYLPDGDGLSSFELLAGEQLFIRVPNFEAFSRRVPEVSTGLLECVAFVNRRYIEANDVPRLVIVLE